MDIAIALISGNDGCQPHGYVLFEQLQRGQTKVTFRLESFVPYEEHAIHIHEFGDLSQGCASLGEHYNPTRAHHGALDSKQRHKGDLINNFTANSKGEFSFVYLDKLQVRDLFGRSVVVHGLSDDLGRGGYENLTTSELTFLCRERGYPQKRRRAMIKELNHQSTTSGNAGHRIACGIIGRAH